MSQRSVMKAGALVAAGALAAACGGGGDAATTSGKAPDKPAQPQAAAAAGTAQQAEGGAAEPQAAGSGPLAVTNGFFVDTGSGPAQWVRAQARDPRAARIRTRISSKPMAKWFGNWSGDIRGAVNRYVAAADRANKLPVLVAYNIPGRDCGGHSSGGAGSPAAYRTWISRFAAAIGKRPAVVVIEPDAVAQLDCLPGAAERSTRLSLLRYAAQRFRANGARTWAYLDAGNPNWIPAGTMAQRLQSAGVRNVRGYAINVSNYYATARSASYGKAVNAALKRRYGVTKRFVVDTSRNGKGSKNAEWCNPAGRKLGVTSRRGGKTGAELLLWVKTPGESDGNCGIAPSTPAGQFSPAIAVRLINGT